MEGKMSCADCHDPHRGEILTVGAVGETAKNESCLKCHNAQRGPFVFEHEAIREGCTLCHKPVIGYTSERQNADRTQREPLSEMSFPPTNRFWTGYDRRLGSYRCPSNGNMLERRVP
jgi:Doubled CXXCH motif (Paired_CXXCH_1).